jgi:hypothetical protein
MNAMRISIAESIAVFAGIPRASRNPNRKEGSDKNRRNKKRGIIEKRRPKKDRIAPPANWEAAGQLFAPKSAVTSAKTMVRSSRDPRKPRFAAVHIW